MMLPAFARCLYTDSLEMRFPTNSGAAVDGEFHAGGTHLPTFDLATNRVIYHFDSPCTVPQTWVGRGFRRQPAEQEEFFFEHWHQV